MNNDKLLGRATGEGFVSSIYEDANLRVYFTADADIDADGANGQNGRRAAYIVGNRGTEDLANGGLNSDGTIAHSWAASIFILGPNKQPKVFPNGILASKTSYKRPDKKADDPAAYLDSETENYIVVPPMIAKQTKGVVLGCRARVTYQGRTVEAVVGDLGPANKNGEISIALARALGIPSSPRTGGLDTPVVKYELWPGIPAPGYTLQPY